MQEGQNGKLLCNNRQKIGDFGSRPLYAFPDRIPYGVLHPRVGGEYPIGGQAAGHGNQPDT